MTFCPRNKTFNNKLIINKKRNKTFIAGYVATSTPIKSKSIKKSATPKPLLLTLRELRNCHARARRVCVSKIYRKIIFHCANCE